MTYKMLMTFKGMRSSEIPVENSEKGEIIAYRADGELHIDVRLENETVWLTQAQMAELFNVKRQAITKHVKNIYDDEELAKTATSSILELVQKEGDRYVKRTVSLYNLDMIISVGFRVNTRRGIEFRQWANQVLKDHLLKGYSVNQRLLFAEERIDQHFVRHENRIATLETEHNDYSSRIRALENQVEFFVKGPIPPKGGIMPANSRWDGFALVSALVKSAEKSVVFIDPFADETALNFASLRKPTVKAIVYTARITSNLKKQTEIHNKQYPGLELRSMREVHDRFLLIDETVYHVGSSFKDIGNKLFGYSILDFVTAQQVMEMIK